MPRIEGVWLTDLLEIGDAVKARRKAMKLTQRGLAQVAGVSLARVEGLENARLPEIGFKHLMRILNALGLDLRLTEQNQRRPTLEDLRAEDDE
nr:helix-turn-helix domain-containing protein [Nitrosomonas nitrosa]